MSNYVTNFDDLLQSAAPTIKEIEIRGKKLFIRQLSSDEADKIQFGILGKDGNPDISKLPGMMPKVCRYGLVTEDGKPIIETNKQESEFANTSGQFVRELAEKILEHSQVDFGPKAESPVEAEKND